MDSIDFFKRKDVLIPFQFLKYYPDLEITPTQFILIIHIMNSLTYNESFISFQELAKRLQLPVEDVRKDLAILMEKGYLQIRHEKNEEKIEEQYVLDGLYETLLRCMQTTQEVKSHTKDTMELFFQKLTTAFQRQLSGTEMERLKRILVMYKDLELIEFAVREAETKQKVSIPYIEAILRNWNEKGIRTAEELERRILVGEYE